MMRVLLINPVYSGGNPWMPLGLAKIASYLRIRGITVKILDLNFSDYAGAIEAVEDYRPHLVGTGGMTVQANQAVKVGRLVKMLDKDIPVVYGGVHFTFKPEEGLKFGDLVITGEGEKTLYDICLNLPGYLHRQDRVVRGEMIADLDSTPLPAYDLLPMEKYRDSLITHEPAISIMTGRGCPYNCLFCASPQLYRRKVRLYSLGYVKRHIEYLVENYRLRHLRIMDDSFTVDRQRVYDFCDLVEKYKLTLSCLAHVKTADYQLFRRMKEVGFKVIAFGVESGNERILKLMGKNISLPDIRGAVSMAREAGLLTELLFMVGNIGETEETVRESIRLAKKINPRESHRREKAVFNWFQFATPFPGSRFYHVAGRYGKVWTNDWDFYHHKKPVFIPWGLDFDTLVQLRERAVLETNEVNQ